MPQRAERLQTILVSGLLLLVVGAVFGESWSEVKSEEAHEPQSMITLIANPEKFRDRSVSVIGVLVIEFEGDRLCLTKEHAEGYSWDNCFEVVFEGLRNVSGRDEEDWHLLSRWSGEYVRVEGRFQYKPAFTTPFKVVGITRVVTMPDGNGEWRSSREAPPKSKP